MKKGDLAFTTSPWDRSLCILAEDVVSEYVHVYTVKWGVIATRDELTVIECKWLKLKYRKYVDDAKQGRLS